MDKFKSKKEPCPQCRGNGRDSRGDNMHRYEDGHAHCFACQYHEWNLDGSTAGTMPNETELKRQQPEVKTLQLPEDATASIDFVALQWLSRYEITTEEVRKYSMKWSPSKKMLIFPFYSDGEPGHPIGKLMGWQGRCFNPNAILKYYKVGNNYDFFNVLNIYEGKGDDLVIVEDFVSAIKIARTYSSMALLGAQLNIHRMKILKEYAANSLTFWLDKDKGDKALELAKTATMIGARAKWILTTHDPKEYDDNQIKETLETHREIDPQTV